MNLLYDLGMNDLLTFKDASVYTLCGLLPTTSDMSCTLPYDKAVYPERKSYGQVTKLFLDQDYQRWLRNEMRTLETMRWAAADGLTMQMLYAAHRVAFRTHADLHAVSLRDHVLRRVMQRIDYCNLGIDSGQEFVDDVLQSEEMMHVSAAFYQHVFKGKTNESTRY